MRELNRTNVLSGTKVSPELCVQGDKRDYEYIVAPYLLALPLIVALGGYAQLKRLAFKVFGKKPKTNCWLVDGVSVNGRWVRDGAAQWQALDSIYNFKRGEGQTAFHRAMDAWWMGIRNAQAVRNRLKIAKNELRAAAQARALADPQTPVRILSLAAGSAQAVIEVVAEMRREGIEVEVLLIDLNQSSLRYARELARTHGVEDYIKTQEGDVLFFNRLVHGFNADIIEMMGLTDYLKDKIAVALMKKIRRHLKPGGLFLTCHVHPNAERYFLKHVVNWSMLYRSLEAFENLLVDADFLGTRFVTEPHNIHSVAIAQKLN